MMSICVKSLGVRELHPVAANGDNQVSWASMRLQHRFCAIEVTLHVPREQVIFGATATAQPIPVNHIHSARAIVSGHGSHRLEVSETGSSQTSKAYTGQ